MILRESYQLDSTKEHAMTTAHDIDLHQFLTDRLTDASPDLLRSLLSTFIDALMGAEADSLCGAGFGELRGPHQQPERLPPLGLRSPKHFVQGGTPTRAGTLDIAIPKLRQGSYFPDWLLQRRKRAERALTSVVATCYLLGVSTRRMEKLVDSLGITSLSKSQVSVMAKDLDAQVEAFRSRPLDAGPYTFVAADALVLKVRENGRVVNVHALVAVGVNAEGYREILGIEVTSAEDGAGWLAFFRSLVARGLSGVRLVTSSRARRPRVGDRRHLARSRLAEVPDALFDESHVPDTEELVALGACAPALRLRPAGRRFRSCSIWSGDRRLVGEASEGRRPSRRGSPGSARVHRLPEADLASDLVEQSPGEIEQGDPLED
ncbi:possible transposase [Rhodococcus jostii RHA1]|uniref:Mutator family transposase n=1 Tax=Rhodococcus jostii (strain RHA1) TaxID=101510 RepID=Q0SBP4_RHOJR|nr:possible transposase [Rhodococcus jostii RHA1]